MRKLLSFFIAVVIMISVCVECLALTDNSLLGDVNSDDTINIKDATVIQKYLVGLSFLGSVGSADVNGDCNINVKDATLIQKYVADMAYIDWFDIDAQWIQPAYAQISDDGRVEIMDSRHGVTGDFAYTKIPVKAGEIYRVSGKHYYHSFCYAIVDSENVIVRWDDCSDHKVNDVSVNLTIKDNEEYLYVNRTGLVYFQKQIFTPNVDKVSTLYGKKIVYDGDSIAMGLFGDGGYAKLISEQVKCEYTNFAQGGGILCATTDESRHSVVNNLINLPKDADLYCFEGGINDYWKQIPLGTYDECDYTSYVDPNTVCGAIETIFRYAQSNFDDKPVCFIIVHKVQKTAYNANSKGDTFADYHDAMVGLCQKYSISYYDAFLNSELDGSDKEMNSMYLTGNVDGLPDGCHPNKEGYIRYYVPQLIELFEKSIK